MDTITPRLAEAGRSLLPMVAAQAASGSAAHLTKYSNITDLATSQKMLIIDSAVVPPKALYDYRMSASMGRDFTLDGGLDGVSHCLEVYLGAGAATLPRVEERCLLGIDLIIRHLQRACDVPGDLAAREAVGLGTDLGGNAIMIGGTNGAHLNSFSLVDLLPHGRACALMNPYYVVFFATAPGMADRLRKLAAIYRAAGHGPVGMERLDGRDLGLAVAEAMLSFAAAIGFPARLAEVPGFTPAHRQRILAAAKNPKLESKLRNMPVPLTADLVDEYMGSVLDAAIAGDPALVRNMKEGRHADP
jgi:alcohol dehydrogenase class IV